MARRLVLVAVGGLVVAAFGPRVEGGTPPAPTVGWILMGGSNVSLQGTSKLYPPEKGNAGTLAGDQIGIQVNAPSVAPQDVIFELNPTTGADGYVAGPGPYRDCADVWHYHGELFGRIDTGDDCGWGEAIRFDQASECLRFLSEATMLEIGALSKVRDAPPDDGGAVQDLMQARDALANLASSAAAAGGSSLIGTKAMRAAARDADAMQLIGELGPTGNVRRVAHALKRAHRIGRRIAVLLARSALVMKP